MALTANTTQSLEKVIADGMHTLLDEIEAVRKRDKQPLVVTVSRRMPHIIFWYKETQATEDERKVLDDVEIITEIALPFINFVKLKEKIEIIIVDDVVYTGGTLNYIIDLTRDISGVEDIRVIVFFYYNEILNFFESNPYDNITCINTYTQEDHKRIRDFIASIIAVTLPIDVSYPLFYLINNESALDFHTLGSAGFKKSIVNEIDNYQSEIVCPSDLSIGQDKSIKKGEKIISYTTLLQSELSNSLNNDFAKIRVYNRLGEIVVMSYAPNILSDVSLRDSNLFECIQYKEIWNFCLNSVPKDLFEKGSVFDEDAISKERRVNRVSRSLVSVANYLYSLSSFNRAIQENIEVQSISYVIKEEDLSLIIGRDLTKEILPLIIYILENKLVSPKAHRKLLVESVFLPDDYYTEYTVSKYMSIDDDASQLELNLDAIFTNAREKSAEFPALTVDEMEYEVEGIMESFESIEKALIIKDYKRKVEINKWVDKKIDEGELVSRYAYTNDFSGNRYWRRFFRKTSLDC